MISSEEENELSQLIRFHLQGRDIDDGDRSRLAALADRLDPSLTDDVAVWQFAREFASKSGDSPNCTCTSCRAYWAVRDDEGML